MSIKKTLWLITMVLLLSVLGIIMYLRFHTDNDIIFGGAEGVFVSSDGRAVKTDTEQDPGSSGSLVKVPAGISFPEDIDINEWRLRIISPDRTVKDYAPALSVFNEQGVKIDSRIVANLYQMIGAAQKAGFDPVVARGYVSYGSQQQLINEKAVELAEKNGIDFAEARKLAAESVELPGTSDHQTGLGIDITDKLCEGAEYPETDPKLFAWLDENAAEFGFVKRYPANKESITGRSEPWHYRYVGITTAQFMSEHGLTLEELAAYYENQN